MKLRTLLAAAIALASCAALGNAAWAQTGIPVVVTSCNTNQHTTPGFGSAFTIDTNGNLCTSGGSSGIQNGSFQPSGNYAQLPVTSSTANVALPTNTGTVVVYNVGSKIAYFKLGTSNAVTAATSNDVVGPGSAIALSVGSNTYLAAITGGTDTTTLQLSGGNGGYQGVPGTSASVAGAVTVADGAAVTVGSIADSAWAGGAASGTAISVLKSISNAITGNLYTPGTAGAPGSQVLTTQLPTSNIVWGVTSAMTGTTSTQVIALVSAKRIYVTKISCSNSHASVGTFVNVQDGSGGTTLATLAAGINYGGEVDNGGGQPLFATTSGNGLYVADVTTGANVICAASGFSGS